MLHEMLALVRVVTPSEKRAVMTLGGVKFMFRFLRITNGWRLPWQGFEACGRPNGSMAASGQRGAQESIAQAPCNGVGGGSHFAELVRCEIGESGDESGGFPGEEEPRSDHGGVWFWREGRSSVPHGHADFRRSSACGKDDLFSGERANGRHGSDGQRRRRHAIPWQHEKRENRGVRARGRHGFAGDSTHKSLIAHGKLTVSSLPGTISGVSASGVYDGFGSAAATLTSRGTPLPGMTIQFQVMGHVVGTAVTNSQGVATLGNVSLVGLNAGSYANAVTANFAGSLTYTQGERARECRGRA